MGEVVVLPGQFKAQIEEQLEQGGGGPHDPGMERRMTAVEADVREIKGILGRLEPAIAGLVTKVDRSREDLAELKGRVSQLPTTITMVGFVLAVLAAGGLMKHFFP